MRSAKLWTGGADINEIKPPQGEILSACPAVVKSHSALTSTPPIVEWR